jgi:hypothetical protein
MGNVRNAYKVLVGNPEWERPLWRHRRRWESNIKMDLKEIRCEGVEFLHLAQGKIQ